MKNGWIRFIDETPPLGTEIIVVCSLAPYNGLSFAYLAVFDNENTIYLNFGERLPIYKSFEFEEKRLNGCINYAHHWAYLTEENRKNLKIKDICETKRYGNSKYPIDPKTLLNGQK